MNRFTEFHIVEQQLTPIAGYWSYPIVSLEDALAPFYSEINQLARSVREAKRHCRFPSEHGLTRDESAAVLLYTVEADKDSLYRILNQMLRDEDRNRAKRWFPYLKLFDSAMEKLPTIKGCIWRGVSGDFSRHFPENKIITWWGITSCSLSANEAQKFLSPNDNSTLFMIEATSGKDISGYTVFPNEKEILLGVGTQLRVKSKPAKHGKLNVVHLEECDSYDPVEISTASTKANSAPEVSNNNPTSQLKFEPNASSVQSTSKIVKNVTDDSNSLITKHQNNDVSQKRKPLYQEFAPPGKFSPLYCRGRLCADCGKCRDWYYTGDENSWIWIRNRKNWKDVDLTHYRGGNYHELFKRRADDATCTASSNNIFTFNSGFFAYPSLYGDSLANFHHAANCHCACSNNRRKE